MAGKGTKRAKIWAVRGRGGSGRGGSGAGWSKPTTTPPTRTTTTTTKQQPQPQPQQQQQQPQQQPQQQTPHATTHNNTNVVWPKVDGPKVDWPKVAGQMGWPKLDWPKSAITRLRLSGESIGRAPVPKSRSIQWPGPERGNEVTADLSTPLSAHPGRARDVRGLRWAADGQDHGCISSRPSQATCPRVLTGMCARLTRSTCTSACQQEKPVRRVVCHSWSGGDATKPRRRPVILRRKNSLRGRGAQSRRFRSWEALCSGRAIPFRVAGHLRLCVGCHFSCRDGRDDADRMDNGG